MKRFIDFFRKNNPFKSRQELTEDGKKKNVGEIQEVTPLTKPFQILALSKEPFKQDCVNSFRDSQYRIHAEKIGPEWLQYWILLKNTKFKIYLFDLPYAAPYRSDGRPQFYSETHAVMFFISHLDSEEDQRIQLKKLKESTQKWIHFEPLYILVCHAGESWSNSIKNTNSIKNIDLDRLHQYSKEFGFQAYGICSYTSMEGIDEAFLGTMKLAIEMWKNHAYKDADGNYHVQMQEEPFLLTTEYIKDIQRLDNLNQKRDIPPILTPKNLIENFEKNQELLQEVSSEEQTDFTSLSDDFQDKTEEENPDAENASLYSTHTMDSQASRTTQFSVASLNQILTDNTPIQRSEGLQAAVNIQEQQLTHIIDILHQLKQNILQSHDIKTALDQAVIQINTDVSGHKKEMLTALSEIKDATHENVELITKLSHKQEEILTQVKKGRKLLNELHQWKQDSRLLQTQEKQGFSELSYEAVLLRAIKIQLSAKVKKYYSLVMNVVEENTPSFFPNNTAEAIWSQLDSNVISSSWDKISANMPAGTGIALMAIKEIGVAIWQDYQMTKADNVVELLGQLGEAYLLQLAEEVAAEFSYLFEKEDSIYPKLQLWELGTYISGRILSCFEHEKINLDDNEKSIAQQLRNYVHTHPSRTVRTSTLPVLGKMSFTKDIRTNLIHPGNEVTASITRKEKLGTMVGFRQTGEFVQEGIVHHRAVLIVPVGKELALNQATYILVNEDRKKDINTYKSLKYGYRYDQEEITLDPSTRQVTAPAWYIGLYAYPITSDIQAIVAKESRLVETSRSTTSQSTQSMSSSNANPQPPAKSKATKKGRP